MKLRHSIEPDSFEDETDNPDEVGLSIHTQRRGYDTHKPDGIGSWRFDQSVVGCFDNMLSRSIPGYDTMRQLVYAVGRHFITDGATLVDLGCSVGHSLRYFLNADIPFNYVGVDSSPDMIAEAQKRYGAVAANSFRVADITHDYPEAMADLTLCVLTLQFIDPKLRYGILENCFKHTKPGGAVVLVEKVVSYDDRLNLLLTEEYHKHKATHGYSKEQIEAKAIALNGVLRPWREDQNLFAISDAGFDQIECFWRHLNFAAWVAVRSPERKSLMK